MTSPSVNASTSTKISAAGVYPRCRFSNPRAGTHCSITGKDDGGSIISTSMRSAEEIALLIPTPPEPARKRDSDKGRWGWVDGDDHHGAQLAMSAAEKYR
jgi:hypothetical protein